MHFNGQALIPIKIAHPENAPQYSPTLRMLYVGGGNNSPILREEVQREMCRIYEELKICHTEFCFWRKNGLSHPLSWLSAHQVKVCNDGHFIPSYTKHVVYGVRTTPEPLFMLANHKLAHMMMSLHCNVQTKHNATQKYLPMPSHREVEKSKRLPGDVFDAAIRARSLKVAASGSKAVGHRHNTL